MPAPEDPETIAARALFKRAKELWPGLTWRIVSTAAKDPGEPNKPPGDRTDEQARPQAEPEQPGFGF